MRNAFSKHRRAGFTLVEIMIVVAIIALLAAIAVPYVLRAREHARAVTVKNDLRMIDNAVQIYASNNLLPITATVTMAQWETMMQPDTALASGSSAIPGVIYSDVPTNTKPTASGVLDANPEVSASFYLPYQVQ